jgi:hypothetical protein
MNTDNRSGFTVLYGQRITNSAEFIEAQTAAWRDLIAGRISVKKANTINREARKILKMFQAGGGVRQARPESGKEFSSVIS